MTRAEFVKVMSRAEMPDLSQAGWNKVYASNMLAAIEAAGCVVVPHKLLSEAHACMRETGWHLADTCNYSGDGVLETACSDVEARMRAVLSQEPGR